MTEQNLIHDLLDALASNLKDLAKELGCSHDTLKSWRVGRRFPSPEMLERLVALAEERASSLKANARALKKVARRRK